MLDLDEILLRLGEDLFPTATEFILLVIALMGLMVMIATTWQAYDYATNDGRRAMQPQGLARIFFQFILAGVMVVPSAMLWRAADVGLSGGDVTEFTLLAYMSGSVGPTYCDRFSQVIVNALITMGVLALAVGFREVYRISSGGSQNSVWDTTWWFVGGLSCVFFTQWAAIVGATLGIPVGFEPLCEALG